MDETSIALRAPLPDGSAEAVVEWKAPRGGLRPGDEAVPRLTATHATLTTVDLDGRRHERRVELAEADRYVTAARELHDRAATQLARGRERAAHAREEAAQLAATIDLSCGRCGVPRAHRGRREVVTAGRPDELGRAESGLARYGSVGYEEYACPRCGSVELFVPGVLPHPLEGR